MNKQTIIQTLAGLTAGIFFSSVAMAAPMLDFETSLEGSSVEVEEQQIIPPLVPSISPLGDVETMLHESLAGNQFSLEVGESQTFDFFDFRTPTGLEKADFIATLAFLSPGSTSGTGIGRLRHLSAGPPVTDVAALFDLTWDQPGLIELANGDSFELTFSELRGVELFNNTQTVQATVTAVSIGGAASVPAPAPLALLALGLMGMGFSGYRRKTPA